jgi:hypothetical protein
MGSGQQTFRIASHRGWTIRALTFFAAALVVGILSQSPAVAQSTSTEQPPPDRRDLAIEAQNPIAVRISLTAVNNASFGLGPNNATLDVLNLQAAVPIALNEDWSIITRTLLPVISQPGLAPGTSTIVGLGPAQMAFFLSPSRLVSGLVLGVGPVVQLPTTTNSVLGSLRWGAGPAAAAIMIRGPVLLGAVVQNVWTLSEANPAARNIMTLQPILNVNFGSGTYIASTPSILAIWQAKPQNRWVVPVGGGVGQIFKIGAQPVNAMIGAYYNVVRPTIGPVWQLRAQVQLLF